MRLDPTVTKEEVLAWLEAQVRATSSAERVEALRPALEALAGAMALVAATAGRDEIKEVAP